MEINTTHYITILPKVKTQVDSVLLLYSTLYSTWGGHRLGHALPKELQQLETDDQVTVCVTQRTVGRRQCPLVPLVHEHLVVQRDLFGGL